ncbi:hypothetical protein HK097_008830 [Rhizophlyctis rosea]|uniref:Dienelactone hydrolase domain-containing protein n=1 Tax=Rhizophlyctis rosea TaxID=64517 RepID=A0AAD5X508_9FUNG|nr:hypothetical protein HK097_008830 [Rhizophlyctis rosea]
MSDITYEGVPYFVAGPETAKVGVIVIQEWWGLNNQIKKTTKRYAEALGGLAISPDLCVHIDYPYRGKVATEADEANHLMGALDWPQAIEDIRNATKYLKSRGVEKVGITGFCMGGALTLASAVHVPELTAGVVFYGVPPASFADPKDIRIPLQYHFGNQDTSKGFSDKPTADKLKETLQSHGKDVSEFYQWEGANHAFMNEEEPAYPYVPEVANKAFEKSVQFFKKHL